MVSAEKPPSELLTEAMAMIETDGWIGFSARRLARKTGRPVEEIYDDLPDRAAVLSALGRHADRAMLGIDGDELDEMSVRERLFEMLMRRLDAMKPFRPALLTIAREGRSDPKAATATLCNLDRALGRLMDMADIPVRGPRRVAVGAAIVFGYLRAVRVWLNDDSEDAAKTMAALDKALARLDGMLGQARAA
ncbi:MAG: hypothetical protein ACFB6S_04905 [Geminicoccaceae bacterium]